MLHTEYEIRIYIETELAELKLTQKEEERYLKHIKKIDNRINHPTCKISLDCFEYTSQKIEELYNRFTFEGFDPETSIQLTKKAFLFDEWQEIKLYLDFIRVIDAEKFAINEMIFLSKNKINIAHAKKMYLKTNQNISNYTAKNIVKSTDQEFEEKFKINIAELLQKYPITNKVKQVLSYLAYLNDSQLETELKITREQLAQLYPTTLEEISTLKMLANLNDREIKERYGISRQELLTKCPLNNDTLKALRSIQNASEKTVQKIFNKPKSEVLRMRTITTEMIKIANERTVRLKKFQELYKIKEEKKVMKKGTIQ